MQGVILVFVRMISSILALPQCSGKISVCTGMPLLYMILRHQFSPSFISFYIQCFNLKKIHILYFLKIS